MKGKNKTEKTAMQKLSSLSPPPLAIYRGNVWLHGARGILAPKHQKSFN
jgi:hypothetical protein